MGQGKMTLKVFFRLNFFVQLGLDFKLNTKIGLDTTHHKLLGHFQAY